VPSRRPPVRKPANVSRSRTPDRRPRILWGSPLPPTHSGVADYAAELLPCLAHSAEVTLLEPPDWEPPSDAPWLAGLRRQARNEAAPPGGATLLHLGNNPYHLWVARRLRRFGGIVVLHDSVLHHLLVEEAADDGDWPRFAAELEAAHGAAGAALAAARRWGYSGPLDPFLFPAREVYLHCARGVIVHSENAARDVAAACPGVPLRRVPLAVAELPGTDRTTWRARLGAEPGDLLLVHLGFLTPAKGLDAVLRALAALEGLGVAVRLAVVGEGSEGATFERIVRAAGLDHRVVVWGYAAPADLGSILKAADLGLVPRYPTAGETSAAVLRFLAAGTPVAVAGYAQFLEFPADAAYRIAPGVAGVADLVRLVVRLVGDRAERRRRRTAARRVWERGEHAPDRAAARLLTAVEELACDVV
jgi:glycosyltransferase involved in cell wall biosynthesis